mmetsp:Transcript_6680/g.8701  ORF Transcript_6680/g.8701 Transcript_6680/m.8701 type:complete len:153 (-) Transcript_6680:77-535(-)
MAPKNKSIFSFPTVVSSRIFTFCLAVFTLPVVVNASLGDRHDRLYRSCISVCVELCGDKKSLAYGFSANVIPDIAQIRNIHFAKNKILPEPLGLPERLFLWNCVSDSYYKCMMFAVDMNVKRGKFVTGASPIQQYHGKWPFIRVLGMQEIIR